MISKRVQNLKDSLFKNDREISLERALLYTESYRLTEGEPTIIRRAKATANILNKVKVSIRKDELIVGNRTIKPRSGIVSPEMDPYWIYQELDTLSSRPQDKFFISERDKEIYREELYPYWTGKSLKDFINSKLNDEVKKAVASKIVSLNQTDKGQGHIIMDFDEVLSNGIQGIISKIEEKLINDENNDFYKATVIVLKAAQKHILRYALLSHIEISNEKDETRKSELLEIERICKKIAFEKPDNFYEACQLFWFICLITQYESNASSLSIGRFDQYMHRFYKHDLENGISNEFLREVLECLWISTNDVVLLRSSDSAKYFAGFPTGYTLTLGGLTSSGRSAINQLSYEILDTYQDILLPQPNLAVRLNELIERQFLNKTVETIRLGTGIPQIFNDEVIVPGFLNRGVTLEDARDYAIVGCVELSIPGKTYGLHDIALFNLLKVMEITLKENKLKDIKFEKIIELIKVNIDKYVQLMVEGSNIVDIGHKEFAPVPMLSALIDDSIENGRDITDGGAKYNFSGVQGIGISNLSDSLYAIKKIVFEEKRLSLKELIDTLDNNFEGEENEKLRVRLINKYDKYGNDNDEVDFIGSDILSHYSKVLERYTNPRGGKFIPGSYTVDRKSVV
jgi:pyruvate formate-lyase/glycerol dehydratase family glycyl radical enzyme